MKKLILTALISAFILNYSPTVYADEMLEKDEIIAEIWAEMWHGKNDNGTEFPESSYKHHLLETWVDENYGSDNYDWTAVGELKYSYKNYYKKLMADWDFNDNDGIWTIETDDNFYSFQLMENQWNMIDKNGDTIDVFPIFSTLDDEENVYENENIDEDSQNIVGYVKRTETPSESRNNNHSEVTHASTESTTESVTERSESKAIPFILGELAIIGIGAGIIICKKNK